MPYNFAAGGNAMLIAEQEHAAAGTIRFSPFTSCIGLMARNGGNVTGVHLVMIAPDHTPFDNAAAAAAVALLGLGPNSRVAVIGQTGMWADNLPGPYHHLIGLLPNPAIIDANDGTYGGRVNGAGAFQSYQNGNYVNI